MNEIKQLKQFKKDQDISFELMARDIDVSTRTLFRWLHGQANPSLLGLARIREYIDRQHYADMGEKRDGVRSKRVRNASTKISP